MDRRRHRRAWRSARRHPRKPRSGRFQGRRRRSPFVSQPAASCRAPRRVPTDLRRSQMRPTGSSEAARRLFAMSQPIERTPVEAYLRRRGITALHGTGSLRFHPRCYYRPDEHEPDRDLARHDRRRHRSLGPTDRRASHLARPGRLQRGDARQGADRHAETGDGRSARPRRALRHCRRGRWRPARASRRCCRCAASCPACRWSRRSRPRTSPPSCSRTRCDASTSPATTIRPAMARWRRSSTGRRSAGIEALVLSPRLGDFNEDLRLLGIDALRAAIRGQIAAQDVARFMELAA